MKTEKGWSCFVFVLLHVAHVAWTQMFQILGPPNAVFALVGEDVTLPASLSPALNARGFDVRWIQGDFFTPVLLYRNSEIITKNQIEAYKGRTVLFPEDLVNGNVSLRLQDVHVSDSGLYKCFVYSGQWEEEAHFTLNVEVVGTQPSISISTTEDQQTRLECSSEKWSSQPKVTWRDMNGVDVTSQSTLTVQRDDEGLLRVSSIIPIMWEFSVFSCLMRSNTTRPAYQSKMGVYDKSARYNTKVHFFCVWNLLKETEMTQHPGLILKFSKVIKEFPPKDLIKITEHYKPQLAYVMNLDISSVLQSLVTKQIITNEEARRVKAKEKHEGTAAVKSLISDMMKKDRAVLVSLWEELAEEFVRCPSPNLRGILDKVTEQGPDLLMEIQASTKMPFLEPHIKDLSETHRAAVSESMGPLDDQPASGDPVASVVGLETQYTELMVIKQDIKDELVKAGKTQERLEEEGATKNCERIWTEQLFKRRPKSKTPPKTIVVSGVAGIGKTTMVQKIMSEWASGTLYQRFAFVFMFKFRELNILDNENELEMSLTTLIVRHYKHLTHDKLIEILQKPESLLFILDGLEEYKHKLDFTDSQLCPKPDEEVPVHILVTSLVSQTLLKGCSVLITSRPRALEAVDIKETGRFVEILGFFPEQRLMYCKKFFDDADMSTKVFQYVKENTILYSVCFNPSYCWMICSALRSHFMTPEKERGADPKTVTEIFVMFLHNILTNHRQEVKNQRMILVKLGKMAYYGLENRIHVFNEKQEMSTFGLQTFLSSPFLSGLLQWQSTVEHATYTFYQINLQEFMAACSFYLEPSGDIEEILKKWDSCKDGRFEIVIRFMAGLAWCSVLQTVERILGKFEGNTVKRIQEWVKQKAKRTLQGGDKSEALRVCHWLCETKNEELIRDAIGKSLKMDFRNTTLSAVDCAVLAAVISCCKELEVLDLSYTPLTPQCIKRLAPGLRCCNEVWLYSCGLTSACCSALSSVLSSPNSRLTELVLNFNNLGDSGAHQLSEGLRSDNCKLEKLGLYSCGLTSACCSALSSVLSSPKSRLTELDLSNNNNLGDSGACQLSEGLRSDNCKLETLWLENNPISESEKRNLRSLQEMLRRSGRQLTIST
ncbi:NACHT, LRR and PYD domains-containing protein 3-like isoform X3 [Erpetoichthys calabaricus]|uniref:NACHT, LRR and PYD domains-containing protein 3-like isoform X3 n=1 Tax=Erpetoichthys calabaricus TaxID=27687 RepID=UPI0022343BC6|nr:NACHT, LRR and PYD domains-containing protein 3-like isoform X3 [Erpetoichthys calabaricus]